MKFIITYHNHRSDFVDPENELQREREKMISYMQNVSLQIEAVN